MGSERTFGRRGLLGQGLKKKKSVWQRQLEGENRSRKREAGGGWGGEKEGGSLPSGRKNSVQKSPGLDAAGGQEPGHEDAQGT